MSTSAADVLSCLNQRACMPQAQGQSFNLPENKEPLPHAGSGELVRSFPAADRLSIFHEPHGFPLGLEAFFTPVANHRAKIFATQVSPMSEPFREIP